MGEYVQGRMARGFDLHAKDCRNQPHKLRVCVIARNRLAHGRWPGKHSPWGTSELVPEVVSKPVHDNYSASPDLEG